MKNRMLALLVFSAIASGCAPDSGPLWISTYFPMDQNCSFSVNGAVPIAGGFLDVAPGDAQFWLVPEVSAFINPSGNLGDVVVGGTTVQSKGFDRPQLDSFVFNYVAQPKLGKFNEFSERVTATFDTSTAAVVKTQIGPLNIIGAQAAQVLDGIPGDDSNGASTLLLVRVQARGHMIQSGATFQSQVSEFPLTVTRSAATCANWQKIHSPSQGGVPCLYSGQNGRALCCDNALPMTPGCP